jgi:hypothetical protein
MRDFSFWSARARKRNSAEGASVYFCFIQGNVETLRQKECIRTVF